jgi:hypothetical protein
VLSSTNRGAEPEWSEEPDWSVKLQSQPPIRQIDVTKLPGTYSHSCIRLTLNADGTYTADWHLCMGRAEALGKWRISGRTLVISPTKEMGTNKPFPTKLDVLERGEREVVFVDPRFRRSFNEGGVKRSTCFMRTGN